MRVNFILRGETNQKRLCVRLKLSPKVVRQCNTEFHILEHLWSQEKQQMLPAYPGDEVCSEFNQKLLDLTTFLLQRIYRAEFKQTDITNQWLKFAVADYYGTPDWRVKRTKQKPEHIYFTDAYFKWLEWAVGNYVKDRTGIFNERDRQRYETPLRYLYEYEKEFGRIKMLDMNRAFKAKLIQWLHQDMELKASTIKPYMQKINFVTRRIRQRDEELPRKVKDSLQLYLEYPSSVPNRQVRDYQDVYLSEDEIEKIFKVKLTDLKLNAVRDTFIIGLRTGYRVGDYAKKLSIDHIDQQTNTIRMRSDKTGVITTLPIHPEIKTVLAKHSGLPERRWNGEHDFNESVREVCRLAGINNKVKGAKYMPEQREVMGRKVGRKVIGEFEKWELVASHTARRSFATNLFLTKQFTDQELCELGGWLTVEQMRHYIKANGIEAKDKLQNLYGRNTG